MSERKTPVLLREGPLSKQIFAVTRYTMKEVNGREVVNAQVKHDVTDDFYYLAVGRLMDDDCADIVRLLDAVAQGDADGLGEADLDQVRVFQERLRALIVRYNERFDKTVA